jgi:hypothetical protein
MIDVRELTNYTNIDEPILFILILWSRVRIKKKMREWKRLLLFPIHFNRFFGAFLSTDPASLTILEIYLMVFIDAAIRAVHGTKSACIACFTVDHGPECPP